ncbi:hypothetical protein [Pseudomonas sp.]|uniref:hypothetical protein n=1 Tax=Pseudomonas sp. TaxID=306 RepID=UPI00258ACA8B|nr:hypothetical protein [Pseudomonas sp.]
MNNDVIATDLPELSFTPEQASCIARFSRRLALEGGPHACGSAIRSQTYATVIEDILEQDQSTLLQHYAEGKLPALLFSGLQRDDHDSAPDVLPALGELEGQFECLVLAARNQLLLSLVRHSAFAYDMDNDGKTIRLVANFKGGGITPLDTEPGQDDVELSSHAGLSLGPHTEPPYFCSRASAQGHSPAPCALILTARWNPRNEPTRIIPMTPVVDGLPGGCVLELTAPRYRYTRSDCFVEGRGAQEENIPILQHDPAGAFSIRYNDYRFSTCSEANQKTIIALGKLRQRIQESPTIDINLQPDKVLIINNTMTLHCRDVITDNRRLLIRLFGYSPYAQPIVLVQDPLIVQG